MSDTTDTRPAKRTRLSDDPSSSSSSSSSTTKSQFKRHAEFWFDDGNIVLVARSVAFRIYRGLLTSQSTVFSDMFSSSSSSANETLEGCPIVQLSDSPQDLAHLLRVLLPKSRIHYQPTDADPIRHFDEVFALVRLAHKYHIQPVQDQALAALRLFGFTDDFNTYSAGIANKTRSLVSKKARAIGAVNLARLTDTPSMLPLALYQCAYLDSALLLEGWKRRDGTVEELSPADLRRCINGRIALSQEQSIMRYRLFNDHSSNDCAHPGQCQEMLRSLHNFIMLSRDYMHFKALMDWTGALRELADIGLCDACEEELVDRNRRGRREIWNKLPEIFDIEVEGWGEPESEEEAEDDDE